MLSSLKLIIDISISGLMEDNQQEEGFYLVKYYVDIAFGWRGRVVLSRPFNPDRSKLPVVLC